MKLLRILHQHQLQLLAQKSFVRICFLKIRALLIFHRHFKNAWLVLVTIKPEKRQQDSKSVLGGCVCGSTQEFRMKN